MPSAYNNYMQLFQTEDYVVILTEMVHEARIVPLDGRDHLSREHPAVARRRPGTLGRRHAGDRDGELPGPIAGS